ncbi:MAG: hypothetical protein LBL52_04570 [Rickettsiales bacterium]|nr:hypothetical protein [Rickettsiales bacterium]
MSNYSDNPSMDEILSRIKRALAGREAGSDVPVAESARFSRIEEIKEYAKKPDVAKKILSDFVADDMFIRPSLASVGAQAEAPSAAGVRKVFRLTRHMKAFKRPDFAGVDFERLCAILADRMSKDLTISYLAPKVEEWLRENMADCAKIAKN